MPIGGGLKICSLQIVGPKVIVDTVVPMDTLLATQTI
jgi:hypothetical protein